MLQKQENPTNLVIVQTGGILARKWGEPKLLGRDLSGEERGQTQTEMKIKMGNYVGGSNSASLEILRFSWCKFASSYLFSIFFSPSLLFV